MLLEIISLRRGRLTRNWFLLRWCTHWVSIEATHTQHGHFKQNEQQTLGTLQNTRISQLLIIWHPPRLTLICWMCVCKLGNRSVHREKRTRRHACRHASGTQSNERRESTAGYRWTGWIRELTGRMFKTSGKSPNILEESVEYTSYYHEKPKDVNI